MLWSLEQRFRHILPFLSNYQSDARLIDFGCGDGSFIHTLKRLGMPLKCVGVDSSVEALARARLNTRKSYSSDVLFQQEWTDSSESPASITIVSALHVLEHVTDPLAMLKGITSNCVVALLEVPIEAGLVEKLKARRMRVANGGHHPWGHINFWMPGEFLELVHRAGLIPIFSHEYAPTLYGERNPYDLSASTVKRHVKSACWKLLPRPLYREIYSSFFFVAAVPVNIGQKSQPGIDKSPRS
jgi:SAM-dependent methyltransferase